MARKVCTAEQIIGLLRQADIELGKDRKAPGVCKTIGVREVAHNRWRREYAGLMVDQATRMKDHEPENARFKRIVANQALDLAILKEEANPTL